ncbi:MAG: hypothetical protein M3O64_06080, partial [Chloroflexota bacterium]|nr:hypothetical protein [Chloroflexota bacterium]
GVTGDLAVATNKFNVTAATGNTTIAGTLGVTGAGTFSSTLGVTGDFAVATNKFTVAAATGNTLVAGTLTVTGASALNGGLTVIGGATNLGTAASAPVHIISKQLTSPTTTIGAKTASCTLTTSSDTAGKVSFTTASGTMTASIVYCTINFNAAYAVAPSVVISPASSTAASGHWFVTPGTANFTISNDATLPVASTAYTFTYLVIEGQ